MKLESLVTSYELSKRLFHLGVPLASMFYWSGKTEPPTIWAASVPEDKTPGAPWYSALTSGELHAILIKHVHGDMLPIWNEQEHAWSWDDDSNDKEVQWIVGLDQNQEAEARGMMLENLLKNHLITL